MHCNKEDEVGWICGMHGEGIGVYRVLVGIPEGKRPLRRPRHRWKDKIKRGVREIVIDDANSHFPFSKWDSKPCSSSPEP
jgi:hypothetical protein